MPVALDLPSRPLSPAIPPFPVRRWTVEEYHELIRLGALSTTDRVELLDGWIVNKMPHNPPHSIAIELVDQALRPLLPKGWRMRIQLPVTTDDSEPEPDLAVVRGDPRDIPDGHPGTAQIALVVEVADSSLPRDREKAAIYARAKVAQYVIVNLRDECVEVLSQPVGKGDAAKYKRREVLHSGETLRVVIDGKGVGEIAVSDMLPERGKHQRKRNGRP